jgi:uncharacterized membrane protein YheB (UPF0754 family)
VATDAQKLVVVSEDPTIQARFEATLAREMNAYRVELASANTKMIQEELERIRKDYGPPKPEEIQKLLDQEYLTFVVKLPWPGQTTKREFTIQELPQSIEKQFYKQIKDQILPRAKEFAAISFNLLEGKLEDKISSALEAFDPSFDILADGVVLVLNPRGEEKDITRDWVQNNISSGRMWNILEAQIMVNRMRDFFSRLSLAVGGPGERTKA